MVVTFVGVTFVVVTFVGVTLVEVTLVGVTCRGGKIIFRCVWQRLRMSCLQKIARARFQQTYTYYSLFKPAIP